MEQHYVGSNFVTSPAKMPGFDYWETNRLDQVGRLTNDRVLFLTFDDWGSDESINKLLYVLKKHHVKATFFALTENVDKNPNLLRAIAADGHEVASHSDSHVPLATSKKGAYHNLTAKETAAMRKDLAKSYQKLNKYVGNVQVGGKKALESAFCGFGQSQHNIADDVYDGAFKDLVINSPDGEIVYYDNRLHGWELVSYHWKHFWNKVIDWFINNL